MVSLYDHALPARYFLQFFPCRPLGSPKADGMMSPMDCRLRMQEMIARSAALVPDLPALVAALDRKRILASGATGFFGLWLHAAASYLRDLGCDVRLTRLSRSPQGFETRHPEWAALPWASWVVAEAGGFAEVEAGAFDLGLHMATSSDAASNHADPGRLIADMLSGMSGMLDLCEAAGARLLMVSSGAVYGKRVSGDRPFAEDDTARLAPDPLDPMLFYGEIKRMCESMCATRGQSVEFAVARPFSFLGPFLPLGTHFAAGNFLADAAQRRVITIRGDGTPLRSYMHPADMICWLLWSLVFTPAGSALNIGSPQAVSLAELASLMAHESGAPPPAILGQPGGRGDSYLPDVTRAHAAGLRAAFSLEDIVRDSLTWLAASGSADW